MRKWQTIKEYEDIKFDFFEGIAKITINRPRVYNAFRPQTNKEMLDAMTICRERNDIGVVLFIDEVLSFLYPLLNEFDFLVHVRLFLWLPVRSHVFQFFQCFF